MRSHTSRTTTSRAGSGSGLLTTSEPRNDPPTRTSNANCQSMSLTPSRRSMVVRTPNSTTSRPGVITYAAVPER